VVELADRLAEIDPELFFNIYGIDPLVLENYLRLYDPRLAPFVQFHRAAWEA
jgi:hypothetical protein